MCASDILIAAWHFYSWYSFARQLRTGESRSSCSVHPPFKLLAWLWHIATAWWPQSSAFKTKWLTRPLLQKNFHTNFSASCYDEWVWHISCQFDTLEPDALNLVELDFVPLGCTGAGCSEFLSWPKSHKKRLLLTQHGRRSPSSFIDLLASHHDEHACWISC